MLLGNAIRPCGQYLLFCTNTWGRRRRKKPPPFFRCILQL